MYVCISGALDRRPNPVFRCVQKSGSLPGPKAWILGEPVLRKPGASARLGLLLGPFVMTNVLVLYLDSYHIMYMK